MEDIHGRGPLNGTAGIAGRFFQMCKRNTFDTGLLEGSVSCNELIADDLWRMLISVTQWTGSAPAPGQFLMLRTSEDADPLLSRPFGIACFEREGTEAVLEILYRVVGRGTGKMSQWVGGQRVQFLGPLGNGFILPPEGTQSLLVAGGIGLPPLLAMAREMASAGRSDEITLLYGESTGSRLVDPGTGLFPDIEVALCTEDGSLGMKGLVTDLLREKGGGQGYHLYVCGPNAMMKAVLDLVRERCLSSQFSLEARMACGFGVCMGCAVLVPAGGSESYVRVCREGPVFDGRDLIEESFAEI
jgi:dihydroorotate dehydrogenase electron transfer subunit